MKYEIFGLKTPLHALDEHISIKTECIKAMPNVRGLSIEPRSSTSHID